MRPDPPDDRSTPSPTFWHAKNAWRGALVKSLNGRPITSTHPRATYWREYKQRQKHER